MQIPIGTGLALGHIKTVVQNCVAASNATFEDASQTVEQLQDQFGVFADKITVQKGCVPNMESLGAVVVVHGSTFNHKHQLGGQFGLGGHWEPSLAAFRFDESQHDMLAQHFRCGFINLTVVDETDTWLHELFGMVVHSCSLSKFCM